MPGFDVRLVHMGFVGGWGTWLSSRFFPEHFSFLWQIIIPPKPHSHLSSGVDTVGPFDVNSTNSLKTRRTQGTRYQRKWWILGQSKRWSVKLRNWRLIHTLLTEQIEQTSSEIERRLWFVSRETFGSRGSISASCPIILLEWTRTLIKFCQHSLYLSEHKSDESPL